MVPLVALLLLGVTFWLGRITSPDSVAGPNADRQAPSSTGPALVDGVLLGYEHTESGAIEAASNFSRVMASVTEDLDAYRLAVLSIAAPEWRAEAKRLAENGLAFLAERYGVGGYVNFSPVRYHVVDYSDEMAIIDLWGVTVATGPKNPVLEQSWLTGTVELVWTNDDWRVAGQSSETGPTPSVLDISTQLPIEHLDAFEEYQRAPAP